MSRVMRLIPVFCIATVLAVVVLSAGAYAATNTPGIRDNNCSGNRGDVCVSPLPKTEASQDAIQNILQIAIGIIAAVALLFIVIGGVRYVLSQGDPQAANKARSTIIYAVIGLMLALVAQFIVILVVRTVGP